MAYDDARHVVLLFGGNGSTTFGDLWSWDGSRWTRLSTNGPPARDDGVIVFDSRRQRLVLFGGRSGSAEFDARCHRGLDHSGDDDKGQVQRSRRRELG